jgi:hypothetical protein
MPNKHRMKKLATKMLASGNFKSTDEGVRHARRQIAERAELDKEDVNFDFETDAKHTDFEKLDAHEDVDFKAAVKGGGNRKRKTAGASAPNSLIEQKIKRLKGDNNETAQVASPEVTKKKKKGVPLVEVKTAAVNSSKIIPSKSKKNKYFFMAHPDVLAKKKEAVTELNKDNKYVIDDEKMRLNDKKKKEKKKVVVTTAEVVKKRSGDENKKKMKKKSLWVVEECSSEDEDASPVVAQSGVQHVLDIDNIDKHFRLKKTIKKLADGTSVQVFQPEVLDDNENAAVDEKGQAEGEDEQGESSDEENSQGEENKEIEEEVNGNGSVAKEPEVRNEMMEKLNASRFRFLNELLYTQPSDKSFEYFTE